MSTLAIEVRGLRKTYGAHVAVDGIDLAVPAGEVFGLLGPNGAGKTSTVEILEGLRARSGGDARVLGLDPTDQSAALKERIGVCLQNTNLPGNIRVGEAMRLFSRLYKRTDDPDALLARVDLTDKKSAFYRTLSGGQQQRLAIALALVNAPDLVFFDEPTTGLDPQVRREIHTLISNLRAENSTVLLTTHYIEEAERLCDRVAIMDNGRVIAQGTPRDIQEGTLGKALVEARFDAPMPAGRRRSRRRSRSSGERMAAACCCVRTTPARAWPNSCAGATPTGCAWKTSPCAAPAWRTPSSR